MFGIINYSRFPTEMLIDQFDNRNNREIDYGIIVAAEQDSSGALLQFRKEFGEFYDSLKEERQHARIVESGSRFDLAKKMLFLKTHFRPQISWGEIFAHGYRGGLVLSEQPENLVTTSDIDSMSGKILLNFFKPDAPIVLSSCHGGFPESTSQQLSVIHKQGLIIGSTSEIFDKKIMWKNGKFSVFFTSGVYAYKNGDHVSLN